MTRDGIDVAALGTSLFLGTIFTGGAGLAIGIGISIVSEGAKALLHKWFY